MNNFFDGLYTLIVMILNTGGRVFLLVALLWVVYMYVYFLKWQKQETDAALLKGSSADPD